MGFVNNKVYKSKEGMITLGIDQSFSHTGFCVKNGSNEVTFLKGFPTNPKETLEERISSIIKVMKIIIKEEDIQQVVIEGLSFNSMHSSARQLAGLFYVILHELNRSVLPYSIIPPNSLKKMATGSGKATKTEIIEAIHPEECDYLVHLSGIKKKAKKFEDLADAFWLSSVPYLQINKDSSIIK